LPAVLAEPVARRQRGAVRLPICDLAVSCPGSLDFLVLSGGAIMRAIFALLSVGIASSLFAGCQTVRQEDLVAWEGAPVSALDSHPVFLTMPMTRTVTADGTEIRNYVNGSSVGHCGGGGSVNYSTYQQYSNCVSRFAACNNIFYIKDGRVTRYTPVGSGGARCRTDETLQPGFRGPTNITSLPADSAPFSLA
jgi:hypothetical protein